MDQATPASAKQKEAAGNFTMNIRRDRGTNGPAITGRISVPEDPERMFEFSAFEQFDEKNRPYWIGPVNLGDTTRAALAHKPEQGTHFIAIRLNEFKVFPTIIDKDTPEGRPNPEYERLSAEQKELEGKKPTFWASWTRAKDSKQIHASAWDRHGRYGPWASGNTQYRRTKAELLEMQTAAEAMVDPQAQMALEEPQPRRARGGRQGR